MSTVVHLAHQGGWDEVVMVAGPIVVFGGLLLLARRRAIAQAKRYDDRADELS